MWRAADDRIAIDQWSTAMYADSQFRYRKAASDVAEMRHIH
jgi:hypothetical protein